FSRVTHAAGHEFPPRQEVAPLPGHSREIIPRSPPPAQPSSLQAWFGLITPPVEAAVLVGTKRYLDSEVRENSGTEVWMLHQFFLVTTAYFIPGVRWLARTHPGLVFGFSALMLVSALASAFGCLLLARRYAFSRARCFDWSLCGLLWGPAGLLLMLAVQEWPARIPCPSCRKL